MIGAVSSANRDGLDIGVVAVIGRGGQEYWCLSAPRGFLFTAIDAKLLQSRYNFLLLDAGTTFCQILCLIHARKLIAPSTGLQVSPVKSVSRHLATCHPIDLAGTFSLRRARKR